MSTGNFYDNVWGEVGEDFFIFYYKKEKTCFFFEPSFMYMKVQRKIGCIGTLSKEAVSREIVMW